MKVGIVVPLVGRGEGCVWEETGEGSRGASQSLAPSMAGGYKVSSFIN